MHTNFKILDEKLEQKTPLGRPDVRIILKWILKKCDERVLWVHVAMNRDQ
jgi:hypothetical protein